MLKDICGRIVAFGVRNAPKILATIGVCGVAGTAIMAAKAAPEANERMEKVDILPEDGKLEIAVKKAKAAVPVYMPAVGMGCLTVASFLGSQHILSTRQAAAAMLASISETALREWQDETLKVVGKNKYEKVMNAVAHKRLPHILEANEGKEITGNGDVLFADCQTGRMFRSSIERVRKAEADISKLMAAQMVVSLNDFYEMLDLKDVDLGDKNGWILDRGDQFEIFFTYEADPLTEEPITVINYDVSYLGRY